MFISLQVSRRSYGKINVRVNHDDRLWQSLKSLTDYDEIFLYLQFVYWVVISQNMFEDNLRCTLFSWQHLGVFLNILLNTWLKFCHYQLERDMNDIFAVQTHGNIQKFIFKQSAEHLAEMILSLSVGLRERLSIWITVNYKISSNLAGL